MAELPNSEKRSHSSVKYENPSTHSGERCSRCKHFIASDPPRCEGVQSPIAAGAWCERFKRMANFIKKAIKRPGRMKRLAAREGISVHQAEERASHSKNKSLRAAGNLGLRFGKGGDLHS